MNTQYTYLRCVSDGLLSLVVDAAAVYSQKLTFTFSSSTADYFMSYFNQYDGDGNPTLYSFPIASNIIIAGLKLSIPNLPGARWAVNPAGSPVLIKQGFQIGASGWRNPPTGPLNITNYDIGVNELNTWIDTNIIVNAATIQGGDSLIRFTRLSLGQSLTTSVDVYVDFRNYQTIFNNKFIYLLAELKVIAPQGVQ